MFRASYAFVIFHFYLIAILAVKQKFFVYWIFDWNNFKDESPVIVHAANNMLCLLWYPAHYFWIIARLKCSHSTSRTALFFWREREILPSSQTLIFAALYATLHSSSNESVSWILVITVDFASSQRGNAYTWYLIEIPPRNGSCNIRSIPKKRLPRIHALRT